MSTPLSEQYREISLFLCENLDRESLLDTPKHAAKAMKYLRQGYEQGLEAIANCASFALRPDSFKTVIFSNIELHSLFTTIY